MLRWFSVCFLMLLLVGCDAPAEKKAVAKKPPAPKPKTTKPKAVAARPREGDITPIKRQPRDASSNTPALPSIASINSNFGVASQVFDELKASLEYGPTLVVWIVDTTSRSATLRGEALTAARGYYSSRVTSASGEPDRLLTALVTYGGEVAPKLSEPQAEASQALAALDAIQQASGTQMNTFAAVQAAAEKYLPYRTKLGREVLFVVVTAERGDDWQQADAPIAQLKKHLIPTYVIGWPAPLGRANIATATLGGAGNAFFGPESRASEAIDIESLGGNYDLEVLDSGFGPFALEWLAHATDGRFLAARPTHRPGGFFGPPGSEWPSARAQQFDPQVMKKYAPDYVSEADYQALLKANAACLALHNAAKLPRAEVRTQLNTQFTKRSEAQFAKDLSKAQQGAAKLEPAIEKIYTALLPGEADRAKLTSARWQAEYDVAMGRACGAMARIEGYNAMLASLKTGKAFEKPTSTTWRLEPADSTVGDSTLAKLAKRSQTYLTRVVTDHPGTPWALIAQRELETQVGWKWVEE